MTTTNKAFIFDWSGTLNDNFHAYCQVCSLIFKELGKEPISEEELRLNITSSYMKFWNHYFPDLTIQNQNIIYEKYIHQVDEAQLYEGAVETVKYLYDQEYKLFVVSSDPFNKLMPEAQKAGILDSFDKIYTDIHEKRDTIISIVKEFELDKSKSFYVGDTDGDIEAGKLAGLKTIAVTWGFKDKSSLAALKPDFIVDTMDDIKQIANKLI